MEEIERAIETIRKFTASNEETSSLSLAKILSRHLLGVDSKQSVSKESLQQSLDILKLYSSAFVQLQKNSAIDQQLTERLLKTAEQYNALVKKTKSPSSMGKKIKQFIFKIAGLAVDIEWLPTEIHIPKTSTVIQHKVTNNHANLTSLKVASLAQNMQRQAEKPKAHELDAFRLKALLLLLEEKTLYMSMQEAISLIHNTSIESTLVDTNTLQLRQFFSHFPGEEIDIKGLFRRESSSSDITVPIKESFQLSTMMYQSGFPNPLQYTGISLSEKLLPECLLRPHLVPGLEALFHKKREIASHLLPGGSLNKKAKKHLELRRTLFQENDDLFLLLKKQIKTLCEGQIDHIIDQFFDSYMAHPRRFDEICKTHEQIVYSFITHPIAQLQQEWLIKSNPNISQEYPEKAYATCKNILETEMHTQQESAYCTCIGNALKQEIGQIYLLQLSEHLGFQPPELSQKAKQLLTSLFRQQLAFVDELQNVPVDTSKELFKEYVIEQIEEEIAIFSNFSSSEQHTAAAENLCSTLIGYYKERFQSLKEDSSCSKIRAHN